MSEVPSDTNILSFAILASLAVKIWGGLLLSAEPYF